jgi:hypothetical protein
MNQSDPFELPLDPYEALPENISAAVDRHVFSDQFSEARAAQDALETAATWLIEALLLPNAADEIRTRIEGLRTAAAGVPILPESLRLILGEYLQNVGLDSAFVVLDALQAIGMSATALSLDDEKMFGHLALGHGIETAAIPKDGSEAFKLHAALHGAADHRSVHVDPSRG